MHELGVVSDVLDIVTERAEELGIARVTAVHVILGEDAGVTEDSFRFHWQLAARGTVAEQAEVTIENQPSGGVRLAWIDVERAEESASRTAVPAAIGSVGSEPPHPEGHHEHWHCPVTLGVPPQEISMGRRLIVQIPNHPGELDRLARALVARGVDVARVAECGRGEHVCALLSVSDEATDDVLRGMGIEPVEGECVSMAVADADGAIVELTSKLRDGGVAVIRSCVIGRAGPGQVEVGLAVDDAARARDVLDLAARETAVPA